MNPDAAGVLLEWGRTHRRDLPWRHTRDPWWVLISEVMLQQTPVVRAEPRYRQWCERFPTPADLAATSLADVLRLWQGMGYPRRARNLHAASAVIVAEHGGSVPDTLAALLELPGVGPYTARAVLVFAFEQQSGVLDTNVGRVLARWNGRRLGPTEAQDIADSTVPRGRAWEWNQTMFDFAAGVCTRQRPRCGSCPVSPWCAWAGSGPDPATGSAAVARRQARFEGSMRQARGRALAALSDGPLRRGEIEAGVAQSLVDDGLVEVVDGGWMLSGDDR